MSFTLAGYSESQDSAVLVNVAALADPHIVVSGDDLRIPDWAPILNGYYAFGVNVTRAQLVSPSLRRGLNHEIHPLDRSALPSSPSLQVMFPGYGMELIPDESLNAQAAEDGAGAQRTNVLVWLGDSVIQPATGRIETVRITAGFTAVANAWTNGAITFDQTLQPGEYVCVGAALRSTNGQAFRFLPPGEFYRPGGVMFAAVGSILPEGQRRGGWGEWFRFRHTTPPTIDVLCNGADAAFTGEMDLIQIG